MKSPCKICFNDICNCHNNNYDSNELPTTPVTPLNHGMTPDKRCRYLRKVASNSQLQAVKSIHNIRNINLASTPTGNAVTPVHNPFEVEVDSLLATSYTPSIFSITKKTPHENSPFWSIEQISLIQPAEIDESSQQESYYIDDAEKEVKAQEAIDVFFSRNSIAPSPWTPAIKCSSFAPHLESTACSLKIESDLMSYQPSCDDSNAKDVGTQTLLTIPPFLDLMTLLGHFCTYQPNMHKDFLDSSFGRRKLFTNDEECEEKSTEEEENSLCLPINQEMKNNSDADKMNTPKTGSLSWSTRTPLSDHCSSSPIARRKFSLCKKSPILLSPDISPLVHKSFRRISSQPNLNTPSKNLHDDDANSSVMMVSICEQDVTTMSNDQISSNKDTGYFTNTTDGTSDSQQFRTTPVAELLEDCAITKKPCNLDTMETSQDGYSDSSSMSFRFNILPWQVDKFSTPTKK